MARRSKVKKKATQEVSSIFEIRQFRLEHEADGKGKISAGLEVERRIGEADGTVVSWEDEIASELRREG